MVKVVELRARLSTFIPRGLNSARGAAACRSARDRRNAAGLPEIAEGGGKARQGSGNRVVNKMKGEAWGSVTACADVAARKRPRWLASARPPLAMWNHANFWFKFQRMIPGSAAPLPLSYTHRNKHRPFPLHFESAQPNPLGS